MDGQAKVTVVRTRRSRRNMRVFVVGGEVHIQFVIRNGQGKDSARSVNLGARFEQDDMASNGSNGVG